MGKKLHLSFTITDNIFTINDQLVMEVEASLLSKLLKWLTVLAPLTTLIGMVSKKSLLYNMFCKKYYQSLYVCSHENTKPFEIVLPLIKNPMAMCLRIWQMLKNKVITEKRISLQSQASWFIQRFVPKSTFDQSQLIVDYRQLE